MLLLVCKCPNLCSQLKDKRTNHVPPSELQGYSYSRHSRTSCGFDLHALEADQDRYFFLGLGAATEGLISRW